MIVKLLTEHHLEFLSLKGGFRGSSESTLVKIPHCWKSHAVAQMIYLTFWSIVKAQPQYSYPNNRMISFLFTLLNQLLYNI